MLAGLLLIGCMEYTVDATKNPNWVRILQEMNFGYGVTDTGVDEDTGELKKPLKNL